jgi:hypothetical protein
MKTTKETAHTNGPWTIKQNGNEYMIKGDGARVLSITEGVIPMNKDAQLIAAAPDMLAALIECHEVLYKLAQTARIEKRSEMENYCLHGVNCSIEAIKRARG